MSIMFALLSSMLLGSADFAGGVAARRAPAVAITVWANGVGLVTALVVVFVLPAPLSLTDSAGDCSPGPAAAWAPCCSTGRWPSV